MANAEHVEIVKKGADAIAAWRRDNPDEHLDLSDANLGEANFIRADLRGARLRDATLDRANLNDAMLASADLSCAHLQDADLSGANLFGANLRDANLSGADLIYANLNVTDLTAAKMIGVRLHVANMHAASMCGADLTRAHAGGTSFVDLDLADVRGLESIHHEEPSTIGVNTLFKSRGKIPEAFLRGCGLPEELIVQLPAIIGSMEPIQFYSCFISYCSDDDAFARRLHARLTAKNLRVWFAPEDMRGGKKTVAQIDEAIRVYDRLLLVLSRQSMASEWVRLEIKRAQRKEQETDTDVLFPIALVPYDEIRAWEWIDSDTGEDLAKKVRAYHIPDFSAWKQEGDFEEAFADLMRDMRETKRPSGGNE